MPLHGRTRRQVLSEFRRAEILEAARRVCAARGFHDMTVDEIAAHAGMAKGTVYLYFRSKHEIYWAMLDAIVTDLALRLQDEMRKGHTLEDQVYRLVATHMRYFEEHRDLLRLYLAEVNSISARPPRFRENFEKVYFDNLRLLEDALAQAVRRGEVPSTRLDLAALMVFDVIRGVVIQRARTRSKVPLDQDVELTFQFIWQGLTGRSLQSKQVAHLHEEPVLTA